MRRWRRTFHRRSLLAAFINAADKVGRPYSIVTREKSAVVNPWR